MATQELREILTHLEWADAAIWSSVLSEARCADDARIRDLLIHIHSVEWAYLQLWRKESLTQPASDEFTTLAGIAHWAQQYHVERAKFLNGLQSNDLEKHIEFPWAEHIVSRFGSVHPTTVRQSIVQVGLHSAYHRGQVNARLRELGGEPPLVDFVVWVWMGYPAPEWPELEL